MKLRAHGITATCRGVGTGGSSAAPSPTSRPRRASGSSGVPQSGWTAPVLHLGSFGLPDDRGDYGSGAVNRMRQRRRVPGAGRVRPRVGGHRDVRQDGAARGSGRATSPPRPCSDPIPNMGGVQHFCTVSGRAFCCYAVVGSLARRSALVGRAERRARRRHRVAPPVAAAHDRDRRRAPTSGEADRPRRPRRRRPTPGRPRPTPSVAATPSRTGSSMAANRRWNAARRSGVRLPAPDQHRAPAGDAEHDPEGERPGRAGGERAEHDDEVDAGAHDVGDQAEPDLQPEPRAVDPRPELVEPRLVDLAALVRAAAGDSTPGVEPGGDDRGQRRDPQPGVEPGVERPGPAAPAPRPARRAAPRRRSSRAGTTTPSRRSGGHAPAR